jgi:WD40 repeat protein
LPLRAQPRHVLFGHGDALLCVALCPQLDLCVSASAQGSMLFHLLSTGRSGSPPPPSLFMSLRKADTSPDFHNLFLLCIHGEYRTRIHHSAKSMTALLYRHVRSLKLPGGAVPSLLTFAPQLGLVLTHSQADLCLHSFTVNGRHRVSFDCTERLFAMTVSPDGKFILTGGAKGVITLMWLHSFQVTPPSPTHPPSFSNHPGTLQSLRSHSQYFHYA